MTTASNAAQRLPIARGALIIGSTAPDDVRSPEIELLSRVSRLLSTTEPWTTKVDEVMAAVCEAVGGQSAALAMAGDRGALHVVGTSANDASSARKPSASDIAKRTFAEEKMIVDNAIRPTNRGVGIAKGSGLRNSSHPTSAVTIPIRHAEDTAGVLEVRSNQPGFFNEKKVAMLTAAADSIGILIHNAKLREAVDAGQAKGDERSQFISRASQELRTPMATMLGFTALLLKREPGPEERMEWYRIINEEATRLTRMTDELLDITHIEQDEIDIELGFVALDEMAGSLVDQLRPAEDTCTLRIDADSSVPVTLADEDKVTRVVRTLIENAIKHSPEGGEVSVSVTHDQAKGRVVVSVTDQGMTISSEAIRSMFDLTGEEDGGAGSNHRGGGLGMYIAKNLVTKMGGEISVKSRHLQGNTFSVSLPVARENNT